MSYHWKDRLMGELQAEKRRKASRRKVAPFLMKKDDQVFYRPIDFTRPYAGQL